MSLAQLLLLRTVPSGWGVGDKELFFWLIYVELVGVLSRPHTKTEALPLWAGSGSPFCGPSLEGDASL